jgi:hypothetical protein
MRIQEDFEDEEAREAGRRFVTEFGEFMAKRRKGSKDRDVLINGMWVPAKGQAMEIAVRSMFQINQAKSCQLIIPPGFPSHQPRTVLESITEVHGVPSLEVYAERLAELLGIALPEKEAAEAEVRDNFKGDEEEEAARRYVKELGVFLAQPRRRQARHGGEWWFGGGGGAERRRGAKS